MVSSFALLALASVAAALQLTSPTSSSVWTVGESQKVTWTSVSSDQDTFNIYLSNMVSYPSTTILLASDVSSSDGSATIDGSKLTAGNSFTINFTNGTETAQIYAQSGQFNITEGSSSSSSSSASTATASSASTGTATSTVATTLVKGSSSSALASTGVAVATDANSVNGTGSTTATTTSTGTASAATSTSGSSSGSSASTATGSSTGSASTAASSSTSGAGKVVAGWVGVAALAAMAL